MFFSEKKRQKKVSSGKLTLKIFIYFGLPMKKLETVPLKVQPTTEAKGRAAT